MWNVLKNKQKKAGFIWTFTRVGDIIKSIVKKMVLQCNFEGGTRNGKKNEDHGR